MDRHRQRAALLNPWTKRITPFVSKEGNPKSIAPGGVRRIIELKDGSILFATMRGGTCMATNIDYDNPEKAEFTSVTAEARPGSMECKHIRALVEDRFGNLWIGQYRPESMSYPTSSPCSKERNTSRPLPKDGSTRPSGAA